METNKMTYKNKLMFKNEEAGYCQECNKKIKGNNWVMISHNNKDYLICVLCSEKQRGNKIK